MAIVKPPAYRLTCKAEPVAPATATDASVAQFIVDLASAGADCRSQLRWLRDWVAALE